MKPALLAQVDFDQILGRLKNNYGIDPKIFGSNLDLKSASLWDIISGALPFVFAIAGIILLFMLISAGFELLTSAGNPEKVKKAQGKITNALLGFLIIFVSYWLIQILQLVLGITIFE